jgi:hypothetical protein
MAGIEVEPEMEVAPITGVPPGVIGRRPGQKLAFERSPVGKRPGTGCSIVRRRAAGRSVWDR